MECEVYILNDGRYQCGNCGAVMAEEPSECFVCMAKVVGIVDEGESEEPDGE